MKRLFLQFAIILLIGVSIAWVSDHPGQTVITWENTEIRTSFAFLIFLVAILLLTLLVLQRLWYWLRHETVFSAHKRTIDHQRRGLEAMNKAVLLLARENPAKARQQLLQAKRLLPPQPMMHVLEAQIAQAAGDDESAKSAYKALADQDETKFIGLYGLMKEALSHDQLQAALPLSQEAVRLEPKHKNLLKSHLELLLKLRHWSEALAHLKVLRKNDALKNDTLTTLEATLEVQMAHETLSSQQIDAARDHYQRALKIHPDFLPATLHLANLEKQQNRQAQAAKLIQQSWQRQPHPETLALYKELGSMERPTETLKRLKKLADKNPNHPLSLLAVADAEFKADHRAEALKLLKPLATDTNWQEALALYLKVLKQADQQDTNLIQSLEQKLHNAIPFGQWVCSSCNFSPASHQTRCPDCHAFATIGWHSFERQIMSKIASDQETPIKIIANG